MSIIVEPASGAGAYISGVDLNTIAGEELQKVRAALGEYGIVFFRNQSLNSKGHIGFAEKFGDININRFFKPLDGYPKIAQVLKEANQRKNIGEKWHTDHSYDQIPALGSILVARDLPSAGGDTLFASMFAAYDALSEELKNRICNLMATHSSRHVFGEQAYANSDREEMKGRLGNASAATQDAVHPVVIRHPISGRRAIYVNPEFTVSINGLDAGDSDELLKELYEHCQSGDFQHRFEWEDGSVAFWDNRATWHKALNDYPGERRLMHRITVEGEAIYA